MVECRLCSLRFRIISPAHLHFAHNITFSKYRRRFPDAPLWDLKTRNNHANVFKGKWSERSYRRSQNKSTRKRSMMGNNNASKISRVERAEMEEGREEGGRTMEK